MICQLWNLTFFPLFFWLLKYFQLFQGIRKLALLLDRDLKWCLIWRWRYIAGKRPFVRERDENFLCLWDFFKNFVEISIKKSAPHHCATTVESIRTLCIQLHAVDWNEKERKRSGFVIPSSVFITMFMKCKRIEGTPKEVECWFWIVNLH